MILLAWLPLVLAPQEPVRYLRQAETDEELRLELAVKTFLTPREGATPLVLTLVGVMHIAEESYYQRLQALLDDHDVVLFEQVLEEPFWRDLEELAPAERAAVLATGRRMQTLIEAATSYARALGRAPRSTTGLVLGARDPLRRARLERAVVDAWGNDIRLHAKLSDGVLEARAVSLGSDGEEGGEAAATDRTRTVEIAVGAREDQAGGIQKDLADALGLAFQLEAIDYAGATWRNSDVSMQELTGLLEEGGPGARALLGALDGSSLMGRFASGLLRFVGSTSSGRGMLKLVGLEVLARSDELFASPPPELEDLFEVLVTHRNGVVVGDLAALLESEPDVARVAIFYGAGHMSSLEAELRDRLKLTELDERWLTAVSLEWADLDLPRSTVDSLRGTIRRSLDLQLGR